MLRTNLEFASLGRDEIKTVLVTSAVEQEGKSTTAANLAIALARGGQTRLPRRPRPARPTSTASSVCCTRREMTDVALGNIDARRALHRDRSRYRAGPQSHSPSCAEATALDDRGASTSSSSGHFHPTRASSSARGGSASILHGAARAGTTSWCIDRPPILRVGDAMTLSARADGLIVVDATQRRPAPDALRELRRLLDSAPAAKLGYVVTGSQREAGYTGSYGVRLRLRRDYARDSGWSRGTDVAETVLAATAEPRSAREEETV